MEEFKAVTRRDCLVAASALLAIGRQAFAQSATTPLIAVTRDPAQPVLPASLRVAAEGYVWSWTAAPDLFRIEDPAGREIASAELQPNFAVRVGGETRDQPGHPNAVQLDRDRATFASAPHYPTPT